MESGNKCCLCTDPVNVRKQCDSCDNFNAHNECFLAYHYHISKCYFCKNQFKSEKPPIRIIFGPLTLRKDKIIFSNVYNYLGLDHISFGNSIYFPIITNGEMCMMDYNERNKIECQIKTINDYLDREKNILVNQSNVLITICEKNREQNKRKLIERLRKKLVENQTK